MNTAQTILEQLGGNRFIAMTGSKNFTSGKDSLSMKLTKNKIGAQYLTITLLPSNTYEMKFSKVKKILNKDLSDGEFKIYDEEVIELKNLSGVYCDQLQSIFTDVTGLYTRL
jgi:hypothetical protein